MKHLIFILSLILSLQISSAQNFHLKLIGNSALETKKIDSLNYISKHKTTKTLNDEIIQISEKLTKIGYIENKIIEKTKANDSSYIVRISLGEQIKKIHIYIGRNQKIKKLFTSNDAKDSIIIPFTETDKFLNQTLQKIEKSGFALTKIKLTKLQKKKNQLFAELDIILENQRRLNAIIIKYTNSKKDNELPKSHVAQIDKKYKNKTFNKDIIRKIQTDIENFRFIKQTKEPEILFTEDSTKIYLYLEKRNSNNFDGYIGFNNDKNNKIILNGYLDLKLENTFKAGETFSLYWKSDGNNQKNFNANLEVPYLLKTSLGIKTEINIFKQDSIFQNVKKSIELGYFFKYNIKAFIGYQSTESNYIQNTNNPSLSDYKNSYLTTHIEYADINYKSVFFPVKTNIQLKTGIGKRNPTNPDIESIRNNQFYIDLNAMHSVFINNKNNIYLRTQNFYLGSNNYVVNELYRFGGTKSIRGFAENSLQAQYLSTFITEYRYILSENLYINSITDYCIYKDPFQTENKIQNLIGVGLGLGVLTQNGLLKIAIANGSQKNQKLDFQNTIVNINYNITF